MKAPALVLISAVLLASLAQADSSSPIKANLIERLEKTRDENFALAEPLQTTAARLKAEIETKLAQRKALYEQTQRFWEPSPEFEREGQMDEWLLQHAKLEQELAAPLGQMKAIDLQINDLHDRAEELEQQALSLKTKNSRLTEAEFFELLPRQTDLCQITNSGPDAVIVERGPTRIRVKLDALSMFGRPALGYKDTNKILMILHRSLGNQNPPTIYLRYDVNKNQTVSLTATGTPLNSSKTGARELNEDGTITLDCFKISK